MSFQKRGHAGHGFGYRPDRRHLLGLPPRRDAAATLAGIPVPTTDCGLDEGAIRAAGIEDQGGAPYCVGTSWVGVVRDCVQRNGNPAAKLGSRLWLMYLMHALEHDIAGFDGAFVGDGAEVLERMGIPPEDAFPYTDACPNPSMQVPPADVFRLAYDQRAPLDYGRIMSSGAKRVDDVLRALSAGGKGGKPCPVVFGTAVTNAFASNRLPPGFLVDAPDPGDIDGGHCMRVIRAVFDPGVEGGVKFRVPNSWSKAWGDGGMFWMTPKYLMDESTADIWFCDYQGVTP